MPSEWTCTNTASGTDCIVVATTTGAYTGPNANTWLLIACIVIFFLSYMNWGRMFRPIKILRDDLSK